MDGFKADLLDQPVNGKHKRNTVGISKISIQTGTSHGGVVNPDGTVADVAVDFDTLKRLSYVARHEYGMAGAVQHGASTLRVDNFHRFPECETAEVHLATNFMTMLFDRLPGRAAGRDLRVGAGERRRRAQGQRHRRPIHLQEPQEGHRPVQGADVGPAGRANRHYLRGVGRAVPLPV